VILTVDQLRRVAAAGGGLELDASLFTLAQLEVIVAAAAKSGSATLTLHNVANLTAAHLTELAAAAPGLITFDLTQ
jgi:DNA replication protein